MTTPPPDPNALYAYYLNQIMAARIKRAMMSDQTNESIQKVLVWFETQMNR